jgi:hypothetical protein
MGKLDGSGYAIMSLVVGYKIAVLFLPLATSSEKKIQYFFLFKYYLRETTLLMTENMDSKK